MSTSAAIPLKCCTKCKEEKPATTEYFSVLKRGLFGLHSVCKKCRNSSAANLRRENPEYRQRINERQRQRYPQTSRAITRAIKRHARSLKPRAKRNVEYFRSWRKKNNEKVAAACKRYYSKNKSRYRVIAHNRRAREYSLPNTYTFDQWQRALTYFNHSCAVCGRTADFWHVLAQDHWVAISDNRSNNPGTVAWNIVPLCHSRKDAPDTGCNNAKQAQDATLWLINQYGKRAAAKIRQRIESYFAWVKQQGMTL